MSPIDTERMKASAAEKITLSDESEDEARFAVKKSVIYLSVVGNIIPFVVGFLVAQNAQHSVSEF